MTRLNKLSGLWGTQRLSLAAWCLASVRSSDLECESPRREVMGVGTLGRLVCLGNKYSGHWPALGWVGRGGAGRHSPFTKAWISKYQ